MVGKRYVVSDLHGQANLYFQIKEYINDNDVVYALGDFGDRGPEPWRTLRLALDDPQFIYLMGNHDFMLMEAMGEFLRISAREGWCNIWQYCHINNKMNLLDINGGTQTLEEWARLEEAERAHYYRQLKCLPLEIRLAAFDGKKFIYLNHAGRTLGLVDSKNVEDFVWDRNHIFDDPIEQNTLMFNGHTPVSYLKKELSNFHCEYDDTNGYIVYGGGSKICIDMGAHITGETVLVDIDTMEAKRFKVKENVNGTKEN